MAILLILRDALSNGVDGISLSDPRQKLKTKVGNKGLFQIGLAQHIGRNKFYIHYTFFLCKLVICLFIYTNY